MADIAAAWGGQLIFDMCIFILILVRSLRIRREWSRSISNVLLQDGMYFEHGIPFELMPG